MHRDGLTIDATFHVIPRTGAVLLAVACSVAAAQTSTGTDGDVRRTFTIVPSVSISETLTDNGRLSSTGRQSDLITQVSPAVRVTSSAGRVKGFFEYSLNGLTYARNSRSNEIQNSLNAKANVEAIENWAYLDLAANISQQAISAFGTQSTDSTAINDNRTEARTFSYSPYVSGQLADVAKYEVRLTHDTTRTSTHEESDNSTTEASIHIGSQTPGRLLGWSSDVSRQVIDYGTGRRTEDDRIRGVLYVSPDPQLRLSLTGGQEANNYVSIEKQHQSTWGWGLDWSPGERTRLSAQRERRFFGNSYSIQFEHRTARTAWRYSDTRDITTGFGQQAPGSQGTVYDLLFAQFTSIQPDPVLRARLVNDFLQATGVAPTKQIFVGSQASAATVQRRQELSFALLGVRDTVTFVASRTDGHRVDALAVVTDDFSNGNLVRQWGFGIGIAHRLTPISSLNLVVSADRTEGDLASQSTKLRSIGLYWSSQPGPSSHVSLGARHSTFESPLNPYRENAVLATLTLQF